MAITIWYKDPKDFILDPNTLIEIIPNKTMTLAQQLNTVLRFSLYFSILVFILKRDYFVFFFVLFVAVITVFIFENTNNTVKEKLEIYEKLNLSDDGKCIKPTKDNPFMNVTYVDYNDFPNRPSACNVTKKKTREEIENILDESCYRDVDDIYARNAGDRQFYTNPSTTIPNDQQGFAEWLYKSAPTCKEKTIVCRGTP